MSMMKRWMAGTLAMVMTATAGAAWAGDEGADDEWASDPVEQQALNAMRAYDQAQNQAAKAAPLAARCVRIADKAIKAKGAAFLVVLGGGKDFTTERVLPDGSREIVAKLGDLRKYCATAEQGSWALAAAGAAENALGVYKEWLGPKAIADQGERENQMGLIAKAAQRCSAAVKGALAAGVPADRELEVDGDDIALGELEARACKPLAEAIAKLQAEVAARREAIIAPFRKALKGDKLALVLEREMWAPGFAYGKGCRELKGAADFARASTWYEILIDTNGLLPRWTTRAYIFKGDKLTGKKERTGRGSDAPSKACP